MGNMNEIYIYAYIVGFIIMYIILKRIRTNPNTNMYRFYDFKEYTPWINVFMTFFYSLFNPICFIFIIIYNIIVLLKPYLKEPPKFL